MNISVYISIVSVSFAIITWMIMFLKNNGKDTEQRVIERTEMNCKLDAIGNNVLDIKNDVASTKDELKNLNSRMIVVEQSVKSAHHRIDGMEEKIHDNE